ncbi:membrane protein insertase YidC [Neisseria leonii]|uniref:Membrane protein insertase YidC n=1 Tax=Neisseria leonii TaxID=2995413 RepID=A0A9X4IF02_9NEIS|nr:membrane protein insertase YidC [Neisseria sp. 51.81]MDD9328663.1 membrane protein insertase YidC [Neisseria sp. 51.81]
MNFKRMTLFFAVALLILLGWEQLFPTPKPAPQSAAQQQAQQKAAADTALKPAVPVTVTTDTVQAVIDENSGDLRQMTLLKYDAANDKAKNFQLFDDSQAYTYIAQADLVDDAGRSLTKNLTFSAPQKTYNLNGGKAEVKLSATADNGLQIDKIYTFTEGSYLVDVRFDVTNNSGTAVKADPAYRVVRDKSAPEGEGFFMYSFTGPVLYTPSGEFQKVAFDDLDDDFESGREQSEYQRRTDSGWVGMAQHYFMATWILQPKDGASVCTTGVCNIEIKRRSDNLYSAGVSVPMNEIAPGTTRSTNMQLYAGPQTTDVIRNVADKLELVKDYGRVHWPATGLFWLMEKMYKLTGNWGWAIVLLTVIVKALLYPLTNASYKSMAKMRAVAPKMEALKKQYGDDRMGMQQAMMQLYRNEKINPLGGCLPMLLQIPVFIGLYWAIFNSVELRQAPWLGWITDLSRTDPWFILPVLMAATMWFQTTLNPPPTDPMQAKMMKIMPLVFSVMFFFFPAGLVLYYVVNNLLSIAQQWYINKKIESQRQQGEVVS